MKRRLVLPLAVLTLSGIALAAPAMAAQTAPDRHKVCVVLSGGNPTDPNAPSYCVAWNDPNL